MYLKTVIIRFTYRSSIWTKTCVIYLFIHLNTSQGWATNVQRGTNQEQAMWFNYMTLWLYMTLLRQCEKYFYQLSSLEIYTNFLPWSQRWQVRYWVVQKALHKWVVLSGLKIAKKRSAHRPVLYICRLCEILCSIPISSLLSALKISTILQTSWCHLNCNIRFCTYFRVSSSKNYFLFWRGQWPPCLVHSWKLLLCAALSKLNANSEKKLNVIWRPAHEGFAQVATSTACTHTCRVPK